MKFRVWDKSKKKWRKDLLMDPRGLMVPIGCDPNKDSVLYSQSNFVIQAAIDLQDKNNNDIYFGDIVDEYDGEDHTHYIITENLLWKASLVRGIDIYAINLGDNKRLEIIGNICENPELLSPEAMGFYE